MHISRVNIYLFILISLSFLQLLFALRTNLYFSVDDFAVLSYLKSHNLAQMIVSFIFNGDMFGFRKILGYINFYALFHLFGTNPLPYILNNHILHTLNIILLFLITKKLTRKDFTAFFVSLIYNKHYLFYFSNVHEYLAAFFGLLSIFIFISYLKKARYALFAFILALLSKEVAFSISFALLVFTKESNRKNLKWFFIVLALYSLYQLLFLLSGVLLPKGNFSYEITASPPEIIKTFFGFVSPIIIFTILSMGVIRRKRQYWLILLVFVLSLLPYTLLKNRQELYYLYFPVTYLLVFFAYVLPKISAKSLVLYLWIFIIFGGRSVLPKFAWQVFPNWNKVSIENVLTKVTNTLSRDPNTSSIDLSEINLERDAKLMLESQTLDIFLPEKISENYIFNYGDNMVKVEKKR